jgi:arylsulfate sulfotransferase
MLFDNGDTRNYSGTTLYSRAVRYEIDAAAMTVRQQWQYGKERGAETYSRIVSDVDFLEAEGHVIFSPGAIQAGGANSGKSVEVDFDSGEVLFEATIIPPIAFFDIITLHRTERLPLYPE